MAGHSKWANIRHRKSAQDAKRGKIFTKHIREITVAAKKGGPDIDSNPTLRAAVDKALGVNMTRDAINRAIKRGAGNDDADNLEEIIYEGYGPNGVAVLVFCLSDNRNRTVSEVRHAFTKYNGSLGTTGSVSFQFQRVGQLLIEHADEDKLLELALEAGAQDVIALEEGGFDIRTAPEEYLDVKSALDEHFEILSAEVAQVPDNTIELSVDAAKTFIKLIDKLEDCDDVQNVYHNAMIPEEAYQD